MYSPHLPASGPDLKGIIISYKAKDYEMPEPPISYSDLVECIRQTIKDGLPSNWTLQYLDIDGDWVMVNSQGDYHAMLECQTEHSQKLIQMSIVPDGDKMSPKVRKIDSRNPIMHIEEKKDMLESKEKPFKQEMKLKKEEENLGTQTDWRKKEVRDMVMQSIYPKIPQIAQLIGKGFSVEARPVEGKVTHIGIVCSQCRTNPITGARYQCTVCENMNLCEKCEANTEHDHVFFKIKNPNQQKSQGIQKEQVVSKNDPVPFEEHDAFFVKEISTIPGLITVNDRMIHKAVCVKNVGAELWPAGTYVKNIGGAPGKDTKLIELIPGEEFSCVLTIENPLKPGDYKSQWRLAFTDEENELCYFGTPFVVNFTVVDLKSEKHVDEEGKSFQSAFDLVFVKEVCTMPAQINVEDEIIYKTILLRNSGKESWPTNVFLRNVAGVRGKDTQLTQVNPGEQVSSILILENPAKTGSYTSSWRLAYFDEENRLRYAGEIFTVIVKVGKPETEGNSQKTYPKEMIEKALKIRDMFPEANIMETLELIAEYPKISLSELAENYMATHGDSYDYDDDHNGNYEETGAFEEYELKKKAFSKLCSLKK